MAWNDIDLIFLDIDGTLIGSSGEVRAPIWSALERLRDAGVALCVNTGRPWGGIAAEIARRLGPDAPHVTHGGALVRTVDRTLHAEAIAPDDLAPLLATAAQHPEATLELYTAEAIYVAAHTDFSRRHADILGMTSAVADLGAVARDAPVVKAQWIAATARIHEVVSRTSARFQIAEATSDAMPDVTFATLTRRGVDKGTATRRAAAWLGRSLERAAAIGDSLSDLPMLTAVAHPFFMGTAPTPDGITRLPDVAKDGLLDALRLLSGDAR